MLQSRKLGQSQYRADRIEVQEREILEQEARVAVSLVERWGLVAAMPEGEDSAGRQTLRMYTPEELVDRAFTVARLAMQRARKDGLVHVTAPMDDPVELDV